MIKIDNLTYGFPKKDLYNNISFTVEKNDHCAFIGESGAGKTTLIEMIIDQDKYMFDGEITVADECKIRYVSQFIKHSHSEKTTVFDYIAKEYLELEEEINSICDEMATSDNLEELMEIYQEKIDHLDAIGGSDYENAIMRDLSLAELAHTRDLEIGAISGGEFKLIQVIKAMLVKADLLIMDETDVFLDFENLNSLRKLINDYKGSLLVITHNRYLLNNCFNKIIHLEDKQLREFVGTYREYNFNLLKEKVELQEMAAKDLEEWERNEILIDRLRQESMDASSEAKGRALNARVKIQERLEARRVHNPFVDVREPEIQLHTDNEAESQFAIKLENYNLSFEEALLENIDLEIGATDKVAIIGANGTGKTSLLRELFKGKQPGITIGDGIEMSYLSQSQGETLNGKASIYDVFFDLGFKTYDEIAAHLFKYGFEREILAEPIETLSGGEKNLLQLAKISGVRGNFLMLDEPTSHLDMYAQMALERAMSEYNGGILMISHDFYSVANSMDYVIIIEDKKIRKTTIKKFRKMIYSKHFERDYLEVDLKRLELEERITKVLKEEKFETAKELVDQLEAYIEV